MDKEIILYIEENIFPIYDGFDRGHNRKHIERVIENSLILAKDFDVDINMVYIIAAYHDLGMKNGRENHHIDSGKFLMEDNFIRDRYSDEDMKLMKEAVEDHRASKSGEPRSMYGKILAEGDRDLDSKRILERTISFGLDKYRGLDREEHIERCKEHLIEKYGRGGYLKLWLETNENIKRLEDLRRLIDDEEKLLEELNLIYDDIMGGKSYL